MGHLAINPERKHFFDRLLRVFGERLWRIQGETEIGWLLAREHWGKGLATEAARAILEFGLSKWRFKRVIASARPEKSQSV
jgi:RimJ/RimL family protein N-acetyltransferase